ncbi:MAG: TetR/AcrR family transcriptional regulator [Microthrixaceae bacterium]
MLEQATDDPTETSPARNGDGRHLRRQQGRVATLDATIDLILAEAPLSAESICEQAGISQASLFRYFDTLDDLRHAAIARYFQRFDALFAVPEVAHGPLSERVWAFVEARDRLYGQTAPMARFSRREASAVTEMAETLQRLRRTLADQIARHFASELEHLEDSEQNRRVAVLASLTSFESWDQMSALGTRQRRQAIAEATIAVLSTAP